MPDVGVKLICKHDTREEAKLYVEFSVGTYRLFPSSSRELHCVGEEFEGALTDIEVNL